MPVNRDVLVKIIVRCNACARNSDYGNTFPDSKWKELARSYATSLSCPKCGSNNTTIKEIDQVKPAVQTTGNIATLSMGGPEIKFIDFKDLGNIKLHLNAIPSILNTNIILTDGAKEQKITIRSGRMR